MSILTRIADWLVADPRQQHAALQYRAAAGGLIPSWQAGKPSWLPQTIETHDQHAYRRVALIFRCVQYLANATGTAPIRVYAPDADEADDSHPLRQLLAQPNPGMGEGRFLSFVAMQMAVTNFTVIEIERSVNGTPLALWPLRSDWIRPILRNQAAPDWEYRVPGRDPIILNAGDVIPITYADTPDQSPTGIGPLVAALREAQITSTITDFVKAFMDRGALPLYALVPQDEGPASKQWQTEATRTAFLAAWKQRYMGMGNAAEPLPLLGVKDVKRIGLDFNELAYADLNNRVDAGICQAFGIPPILVSAPVGLERSTFSNTAEARRSFYEDTMAYLWARIDDAFTRHLLPEFEYRPGWDIHFDTSEVAALQDDRNEATTRAVALFTSGLASRHAAQLEAGIDVHGPDEFLIPFNMVPLPNVQRAAFIEVGGPMPSPTAYMQPYRGTDALATGELTRIEPRYITRNGRTYINERALSPTEREQRAAVQRTNQRAIDHLADLIEPKLADFLTGQRDRVLDAFALRAVAGNGQHEHRFAAEVVDWANEDDLLLRLFAQWWDTAAETARDNAARLLDIDINWAVSNPYIADVQGILGDRIVGINLTTRIDIEDRLTDLLGKGTSPQEMAESITGLFDETYRGRSMTIARTESMVAYGEASTLAYEASGVVNRVQVMDNPSHIESYPGAADGLTCAGRNGLVVPLDRGTFHIRSDHPNGSASLAPIVTPLGEV